MNLKKLSLLCVPYVAVVMSNSANAAVKIGNLSRANKAQAYQQINESRYQADLANQQAMAAANAAAAVPQELPITVTNQELAQQIQSGDSQANVSMEQLEKCSRIYPNGEFMWSKPTAGRGAGGATTCVAVVEMRAVQAGPNGEDLVVARANLAAGDMLNCNISAFPQVTWLADAGNVEFPADAEPTKEEVIAVMNEEQKQHAGLKILAGGLVSAIAGNAIGKNDPGKDSLFGTGKTKMKSTAVAALGGATLMAASSYGGKVGGDMIMSAGINAAAGALVGNMSGSGDSVLRVEKCVVDNKETTCLYGRVSEKGDDIVSDADYDSLYIHQNNKNSYLACKTDENKKICDFKYNLMDTVLKNPYNHCGEKNSQSCNPEEAAEKGFEGYDGEKYCRKEDATNGLSVKKWVDSECDASSDANAGPWIPLEQGYERGKTYNVMLVGFEDKPFGWKKSEFTKDYQNLIKGRKIVGRDGSGNVTELADKISNLENGLVFEPLVQDAEDGSLIDLDNKARMKSTLVGAGAGAGLGAFTAYQGAQTEIEERLVSAIREYKDSLNRVYCITGNRLLSIYNDPIQIPNMPE